MKQKIALFSIFIALIAAYIWIMPARGQLDQLLQAQQQEMSNMQKNQDAQKQQLQTQISQLQQNQQQALTNITTQQQQQLTALQTQLQQAQAQGANNIQLQQMRDNIAIVTLQNQQYLAITKMQQELEMLNLTQQQQRMEAQFAKDLEILQAQHKVAQLNITQPPDPVAILAARHKVDQLGMQKNNALNELQAQQNIERTQKQQAISIAQTDNDVAIQKLRNSQNVAMAQLQGAPAAQISQMQQQNADYDKNMAAARQNALTQQQQEISNLQTQLQNLKTQNTQNYNNLLANQQREMDALVASLGGSGSNSGNNSGSGTGDNTLRTWCTLDLGSLECLCGGVLTNITQAQCLQNLSRATAKPDGKCYATLTDCQAESQRLKGSGGDARNLYACPKNFPDTCAYIGHTNETLEACAARLGTKCYFSSDCEKNCGSSGGEEKYYDARSANFGCNDNYRCESDRGETAQNCIDCTSRNCNHNGQCDGQGPLFESYVSCPADCLSGNHTCNYNGLCDEASGEEPNYCSDCLYQSNVPTLYYCPSSANQCAQTTQYNLDYQRCTSAMGGALKSGTICYTTSQECDKACVGASQGLIKASGTVTSDAECQVVNIQGTATCAFQSGTGQAGTAVCSPAKIIVQFPMQGNVVSSEPPVTSNPDPVTAIIDLGTLSGSKTFNIRVKIPNQAMLSKDTGIQLIFQTPMGQTALSVGGVESYANTRPFPSGLKSCQGTVQIQTLPPFYLRDTYNSYQARSKVLSFGDYSFSNLNGFFDVFVKNIGVTLPLHMGAQAIPPEQYYGPAWTDLNYLSSKYWGVSMGDQLCYRAFVVPSGQDQNVKANRIYADASQDYCWIVKDPCNHNSQCDAGETPTVCPDDCSANACNNNGNCDNGETTVGCPNDCPTTVCGNGKCEVGETNANCSKDCAANCNNNTQCDPGETSANCPNDCANIGQTKCDDNGCITISAQNAPGCNLGDVKLTLNFKNSIKDAKAYVTLYGGKGVKFVSNLSGTDAQASVFGENVSWNLGNFSGTKTLAFRVSFDTSDPGQLITYTFGKMQLKYFDSAANAFQTLPIPDAVLSPTCTDSICNNNGSCDFESGENVSNCSKDCVAYKDQFYIATLKAQDLSNGNATLRGSLVSLGNVKEANVYFQYFKCAEADKMTVAGAGTLAAPDLFEAKISGLEDGSEYCYIALAANKNNEYDITIGEVEKFIAVSDGSNKYPCPDVVSPLEGESVSTLTPTLKWNAATGKYFKVALYPNLWNSTTTPIFQSGAISANSVDVPAGKLNWGKKYAWGFLVCADSAMTDCNATYCWQKEFAAGTVLKSPNIIKPALNGSSTAIAYTPSTDIEWEYVPNAQIYKYAVSLQGGGIKSTATTTEKTATVMLPTGTYVLAVWACEKPDMVNCSNSSTREFIVKDKDKELSQCSSARFGTASFNPSDPLPETKNSWMTVCKGDITQCSSKNLFKEYQIFPNYKFFAKDESSGKKYYFGEGEPLPLDKKLLLGAEYLDLGMADITDPLLSGGTSPAVTILDGSASEAASAGQAIQNTKEIEGSNLGLVISNPFSEAGALVEDNSTGEAGSYFGIIAENGKYYIKTKATTGEALLDSPAKIAFTVPNLATYQTIDNIWFNEGCINGAERVEYAFEIQQTSDKCSVEIKDNGVVVKGQGDAKCNSCHDILNKDTSVDTSDAGMGAWNVGPISGSAIVGSEVECCDSTDATANCVKFDKKYINSDAPGVVNPQFTVDTCKYPAEGQIRWAPATTTIQKGFEVQICKKVNDVEECPLTIPSTNNPTAASVKAYFGYADNLSANQLAFDSSDPAWYAKVKLCGGVDNVCNDAPALVSAGQIGSVPKKIPEITVQSVNKEEKKIVFQGEISNRQQKEAIDNAMIVGLPTAANWLWYRADTEQSLLNASSTTGDVGLKGKISTTKTMEYVDGRQFWIELQFGAEAGGCSAVTSTINGSGVRICSGCGGGSD